MTVAEALDEMRRMGPEWLQTERTLDESRSLADAAYQKERAAREAFAGVADGPMETLLRASAAHQAAWVAYDRLVHTLDDLEIAQERYAARRIVLKEALFRAAMRDASPEFAALWETEEVD